MTDNEFNDLQAEYDLCGVDGRLRDFAEAVQAAERERWRDKVEALAISWDDPAEAYGMKLALQEGLGLNL